MTIKDSIKKALILDTIYITGVVFAVLCIYTLHLNEQPQMIFYGCGI